MRDPGFKALPRRLEDTKKKEAFNTDKRRKILISCFLPAPEKQRLKTRERNNYSKKLFERSEFFLRQTRSKCFSSFSAALIFWFFCIKTKEQ